MTDIFESLGVNPMLQRAAKGEVVDPEKVATKRLERAKKGKSSKAKGQYLTEKAMEYYQEQGMFPVRVDSSIKDRYGKTYYQDLLGIADLLVFAPGGRCFLVQVTTKDKLNEHERKVVNNTEVWSRSNMTRFVAALKLCDMGHEFRFLTWDKVGNRYASEELTVTREWLVERHLKLQSRRGKHAA